MTLLGSEDGLIVRPKLSLPSNILSSFIPTLNEERVLPTLNRARVIPALNSTVNVPEL